jgi:methanogenic corrinoid protein MtbC1
MRKTEQSFVSIQQAEQESGINKETLRKWELRYGFPVPLRQTSGERLYTPEDIQRLRVIKSLVDAGHRPGKVVNLPLNELRAARVNQDQQALPAAELELIERVFARLHDGDVPALQCEMETALLAQGLKTFVEQTLPPLIARVGNQWENGSLAIHQEHLFSEVLRAVLQSAASRLRGGSGRIRVLMGTAPDEQHGMGLTMLQALLTLEGAHCINLGTQVPLIEMVKGALSYRAQIVAVSFSLAYPSRQIEPFVLDLRQRLRPGVVLWAGGAGVDRLRSTWPGVVRFDEIGHAAQAISLSLLAAARD